MSSKTYPIRVRRSRKAVSDVPARQVGQLSLREAQVMHLLCEGLRNSRIADRLGLSPRTVELYRASAFEKLGARTGPQAAVLYYQQLHTAA